jgi:hypothetical protein
MTNTTPSDVAGRIKEHGRRGREALQGGDPRVAEEEFLAAWALVPEPKTSYDFGQLISRGVVTLYRDTGQFEKAKDWLKVVREAYGPEPDASVEFLAGTVHYEAGEHDAAFERFDDVFRGFGQRPFQGSKPDYLKFYKSRAARPARPT